MTVYSTARPIRALEPHNCFGCGELNHQGLQLIFYAMDGSCGVWSPCTPGRQFEGYGGIIHGGIVSTLLDEIMAWSLYHTATWAVTATMSTRFRRPLEVDVPVRLIGRIVRDRGRLIDVHGEIRRADDDVLLAESDAVFMRVPESQAKAWSERYGTLEGDAR